MNLLSKIGHLPVLKEQARDGPIGYFDLRPVEIAEITLEETYDPDTRYGSVEQKSIPQRRSLVYALGRTEKNELVASKRVDDKSGLVQQGSVLLDVIDYRTVSKG